jgi:hypothetical protein
MRASCGPRFLVPSTGCSTGVLFEDGTERPTTVAPRPLSIDTRA